MKRYFLAIFIAINLIFVQTLNAETLSHIPDNPTSALIILHGFGGDAHALSWMTKKLRPSLPNTAFYYPTAPDKTPVGGYQWFVIPYAGEIIANMEIYQVMIKDALKNVPVIHNLVNEIHKTQNISYENIYVAGFSQGGLMALLTGLTNPHQLTKIISFSGVPLLFTSEFKPNNIVATPDILIMQGDRDNVIPKDSLKMTTETLITVGIEPYVRVIRGLNHGINSHAGQYLIDFINDNLD